MSINSNKKDRVECSTQKGNLLEIQDSRNNSHSNANFTKCKQSKKIKSDFYNCSSSDESNMDKEEFSHPNMMPISQEIYNSSIKEESLPVDSIYTVKLQFIRLRPLLHNNTVIIKATQPHLLKLTPYMVYQIIRSQGKAVKVVVMGKVSGAESLYGNGVTTRECTNIPSEIEIAKVQFRYIEERDRVLNFFNSRIVKLNEQNSIIEAFHINACIETNNLFIKNNTDRALVITPECISLFNHKFKAFWDDNKSTKYTFQSQLKQKQSLNNSYSNTQKCITDQKSIEKYKKYIDLEELDTTITNQGLLPDVVSSNNYTNTNQGLQYSLMPSNNYTNTNQGLLPDVVPSNNYTNINQGLQYSLMPSNNYTNTNQGLQYSLMPSNNYTNINQGLQYSLMPSNNYTNTNQGLLPDVVPSNNYTNIN